MIRLGWLLWAFAGLPTSKKLNSLCKSGLDQARSNDLQSLHWHPNFRLGIFLSVAAKKNSYSASEITTDAPNLTLNAAVPKPMDGVVLKRARVAEKKRTAAAALKDRVVAELQKIQAGELVAMLMRHAAILQSGSHFAAMKTRSATMMPKHASTRREAAILHSINTQLTLARATVTETSTSWTTETDTETVTVDGTTTVKTVSTKETTLFVTVSRGATDDEATMEEVATGSDRKHKRLVPAAPHKPLGREARATTKTLQPVVLRPAASLNALADGLARRGIPIHRRATDTDTVYETEKATTTITDTETKTEWTTKYSDSITTHTQTVTVYVQDQTTVTVGPTGTSASSSESGSGDGSSKATIIGAAVGGGLGLILIVLLAFFLWRRRKSSNETHPSQVSQVYAASHSEAPAMAQKSPPPFVSPTATPTPLPAAGARDTWASSPSQDVRGDYAYAQPPEYKSPPPELADTRFAHEMHTSPQRSPQELYHPQYMSGLALPGMRDQQRG
ncbi:Ff.00g117060.m01.CDS01 [Fusarium sp. VM40]|nr:Ff.00g117060.m01.CDS01 [Fusarium sp. VM40]